MNLQEMAEFVCDKVNQSESEDIERCKGFLKQRFKLIWAQQLWKDALVEYRKILSPTGYTADSNWLPTKGVLLAPPLIERVVAARTDIRKLNVQRQEFYYRVDYDQFAKTGDAAEFVLLPPAVWELDDAEQYLYLQTSQAPPLSVKIDQLDSDGVGVTRRILTLTSSPTGLGQVERIDALITAAAENDLILKARSTRLRVVNNSIPNLHVDFLAGQFDAPVDDNPEIPNGGYDDFGPGDLDNFIWHYPIIIDGTLVSAIPAQFSGVITVAGDIVGPNTITFEDDSLTLVTIPAGSTAAARRQRVRLLEIPSNEITLRLLGKRTPPEFSDDLDEPGLTGVENCLLAFAHCDMLQAERQYGKAQSVLENEAKPLLEQLIEQEVVQQSHNQRVIPETGYSSDFGFGRSKTNFF